MANPLKVLVTGATGFLGHSVMQAIAQVPHMDCIGSVRRLSPELGSRQDVVNVGDLNATTDWSSTLSGIRVVIHTAARAHIMKDEVADPLAEYRKINVDGTLNLARQAAKSGVERFIFISSIKVNGEQTFSGAPFTAEDNPSPEDAYGLSKLEAEQGLRRIAEETGMDVVIVRPPLVYGPGVKGNFASMIKMVERGIPLPLGSIHNKRSLVALDNLVDLIVTCIEHPAAANQVFLAGDGHDLSTTELLRGVAGAMAKPPRLIPVPTGVLMLGATLLGKKAVAQRLLGSLQVDISKARNLLGWTPPVGVEEGLRRCFANR